MFRCISRALRLRPLFLCLLAFCCAGGAQPCPTTSLEVFLGCRGHPAIHETVQRLGQRLRQANQRKWGQEATCMPRAVAGLQTGSSGGSWCFEPPKPQSAPGTSMTPSLFPPMLAESLRQPWDAVLDTSGPRRQSGGHLWAGWPDSGQAGRPAQEVRREAGGRRGRGHTHCADTCRLVP